DVTPAQPPLAVDQRGGGEPLQRRLRLVANADRVVDAAQLEAAGRDGGQAAGEGVAIDVEDVVGPVGVQATRQHEVDHVRHHLRLARVDAYRGRHAPGHP